MSFQYKPIGDGVSSLHVPDRRPAKDVMHAFIYLFVLTAVYGVGIYVASGNDSATAYDTWTKLADYDTCKGSSPAGLLGADPEPTPSPSDLPPATTVIRHIKWFLVAGAGLSFVTGLLFLEAFKRSAQGMMKVMVGIKASLPAVIGLACLSQGVVGPGIVMLLLSAFTIFVFYLWRQELALCGRLLSLSATGLQANPSLISFTLLMKIGLLGFIIIPHAAFMGLAFADGSAVLDPSVQVPPSGQNECTDPTTMEVVPCCLWQTAPWVSPYVALASFSLLWSIMLAFEMRLYVIASSITDWYYAPQGAYVRGNVMKAVGHAFGPAFGTLAYGSLVLTLIDIMRRAAENARRQNSRNILVCLVTTCMACFAAVFEALTKFATIHAAITGQAFCDAGRDVVSLLKRNFLAAYGVWWLPPMVLNMFSFIFSAGVGVAIYLVSLPILEDHHGNNVGSTEALIVALITGFLSLVILAFFSSILLNIVDSTFVLYAMDRDQACVTMPDIHAIFGEVPSVKAHAVVEQPTGDLAYGSAPRSATMA
mmetsp:Transcript_4069/g.14235  ORF Transcript_4069/g.14235 Transcript_4069/m.14235 type:complete len:537 (-) Transcript_4069:109-1719(-)|eukprot:CAMPEP_0170143432 /NCGR_PEP_ID=MMETSP0033_2-20121228/10946_1 /TAXON_ID=195969 /ORGANISM="Dolichomastix tenuilepis, Strain CCMP3274" /LENGTH=536 /DNA_ID=CAMNT_0010379879 /DNA_START=21 /DNA_END=1631 /DNA_ORIENTATION=+